MARKTNSLKYYEAIGRRKTAVARVRLYLVNKEKLATVNSQKIKQGEIQINKKPLESFNVSPVFKSRCMLPLTLTENQDRFAISVMVNGGGTNGQLEAIIHGIARAIEKVDKATYRPILKKNNLLTRDPRVKERRKVGTGGKARRKKQSPKR